MSAERRTNITDDIWRRGVPLDEAVWVYATDAEAAVLAKLPGPLLLHEIMAPISQALLAAGIAARPDLQDHPEHLQFERYSREAKQLLAGRKAVTREIQDWFIAELKGGRFELNGYAIPRHSKDRPIKIPVDLYNARFINWEGSTVKGNGLEFVAAVIVETETAPQIQIRPDDKLQPLIEHQKRNPVSAHTAIETTIRYMIDNDLLRLNRMQKQLIPLIRQYIHKLYPEEFPYDRGLSKESIRLVLVRLFGTPTVQ